MKRRNIMETGKKKISLNMAILLIALTIAAGAIAVYVQYDKRQKYIIASEKAFADNETYVNSVFDRIESNLAKIRKRESIIHQSYGAPENYNGLSSTERIQHEIDFIDHLLNENNFLIAELQMQLDDKDARLKGLEGSVKEMRARIDKYQQEVNLLIAEREALQQDLNESVQYGQMLSEKTETLAHEISVKSNEIEEQKRLLAQKELDLHKAHYIIGSYKSLRDLGIIQKEGGVLGINRVKTLSSDPDIDLFHEIDTRSVTKIPVVANRWEIITGQDPESYEPQDIDDRTEWIHITDPEKFWKKSNLLVIVVPENALSELASSR
ncbi:MAG: hypothetical protein R6W71_04225 [Bacteroidales bacterium]